MAVLLAIILFVLGLVAGLLFKGVNINITHKHEQPKQEAPKYNESLSGLLDPEVKNYYQKTQGMNKF